MANSRIYISGPSDRLANAQSTIDRRSADSANSALVSGRVFFSYFTSDRDQTVTRLALASTATAAGATPTLVRFGIYQVGEDDSLTLLGAIANDTSLFSVANTVYERALTTSVDLAVSNLYAVGTLIVTGAAPPTVLAHAGTGGATGVFTDSKPRIQAYLAGQTDLPASVADASLSLLSIGVYAELR